MSFLYVKVYYGLCKTFHRCVHRPELLYGLRDRLQKLGFRVDLKPVEYINYCMLEMCGHEIFRCNLQHLKFNTPWYRDPVCAKAVEAVMASAVKFRRARSYLWFWSLMDNQMFRKSMYAPPNYFADEVLKKYKCGDTFVTHNCEDGGFSFYSFPS
ncbi:UPF0728 protein-like [Helicoverpa armigera]|uniref:UPF0728 protein-like n=1 Tax=Helicoverpa armigera TaxID=29058 RepID=UPI003082A3F1